MNKTSLTLNPPILVICFGVSGCGKSTVAEHLAMKNDLHFIEADDFHPEVNKAHMASGKPLTDAMREPWINALCEHISAEKQQGKSCVMANSGLRRAHRQRFRELGLTTLFLHLDGTKEIIAQRMALRVGHYMPPTLLDSQFAALEPALKEPDIKTLNIDHGVDMVVEEAQRLVEAFVRSQKLLQKSG